MLKPTGTTVHREDDATEEYAGSGLPDRFVVENARIVTPDRLIESVFVDTGEPLTDRVARVTSAPAEVAGLEDRGRLVEGNRADFVVLNPDSCYAVSQVFLGGRETLRTRPTR